MSKKLNGVTNEELEEEMKRRKEEKKHPLAPLLVPDFKPLREMIIKGIQWAAKNKYMGDDFQHYVYEAAMEAVYGQGFWDWKAKQGW